MVWVPTCMGHDRRAALRDHYFCYPHPSVLDRNQCPTINFLKETNGSTTISIAKQRDTRSDVSVPSISDTTYKGPSAFSRTPAMEGRVPTHFLNDLPWFAPRDVFSA